jgi:hypothetical protein
VKNLETVAATLTAAYQATQGPSGPAQYVATYDKFVELLASKRPEPAAERKAAA